MFCIIHPFFAFVNTFFSKKFDFFAKYRLLPIYTTPRIFFVITNRILVYIVYKVYTLWYNRRRKELIDMLTMNATDVRKNWSEVTESVIREKPRFIKKTRDYMLLSNMEFISELLSGYSFTANKFIEDDGSVTLSLNELDLIENGSDEKDAINNLSQAILEYAADFYNNYNVWSVAPNRKKEIPYVFKALVLDDISKIGECIKCRDGRI